MTGSKRIEMGPSERANRRILAICAVMGGGMGLAMALVGRSAGEPISMFDGPLPRWFALVCVALWGLALPLLSWRWHRVVDEHEQQAYSRAAVAGTNVMGVGAPVWWFLWRGGMAPAVDAFTLYVVFMAVTGAAWMWHKYR